MRVILFHIGDFPVRSYGLIVGLAILLVLRMKQKSQPAFISNE
jgi:prolipoprotein diacylglyceryltransferase